MLNNFNNWNKVGDFFKNMFKTPTPSQQQVSYGGMKPIQGYNYSPYQVKAGDTFESIAKNSGLDMTSIQQANNGMLVPPPKGSYINIPQNSVGPVYGPPKPPQAPPSYGAPVSYGQTYPQPTPLTQSAGASAYSANSFTNQAGQVNTAELVPALVNQLTSGALPPIPFQAQGKLINPQTGQPITDSELQQMGYNYDQRTQTWKAGNQQTAGGGQQQGQGGGGEFANTKFMQQNAAQGTSFLNQLRYDPSTGKYAKIGDLIKQGKLDLQGNTYQRRERNRKKPKQATNAGGTPTQGMNTNSGGG